MPCRVGDWEGLQVLPDRGRDRGGSERRTVVAGDEGAVSGVFGR